MAVQHLINATYAEPCGGECCSLTPNCGHEECGLLCDVAMAEWRQGNQAESDFHMAPKYGGDLGRGALQDMLDSELTLTEAASRLGVHPSIVCRLLVRDDYTLVLEAEALLRSATMTRLAVSKAVGLPFQSVYRLAEALHAPEVSQWANTAQDQAGRIEELRGQGWSIRQIAAEVGLGKSAVSRYLSRSTSLAS